jgi:hypothetical protein
MKDLNTKTNELALYVPEFIPYYWDIKKQYSLSHMHTLLYGFMRFFTKANKRSFFPKSEQLAILLECTKETIDNMMSDLRKLKLISSQQKRRSGGGTIRFATVKIPRLKAMSPHVPGEV